MIPATATNSNTKKGLDEPLTDPTNDLLDVDQHARALANYIREQEKQLPFTVGIFGEWGEGKTTMVGFLEHHLRELRKNESQQEIKFVTFSAWPFTTSEKLWRALILKIAKVLFPEEAKAVEEKQKQLQENAGQQSSKSWTDRMSHFLSNDFFPRKDPPTPLTKYEKFLKELEETDFGRISKRTPTKQVNQDENDECGRERCADRAGHNVASHLRFAWFVWFKDRRRAVHASSNRRELYSSGGGFAEFPRRLWQDVECEDGRG